MRRRVQASRRSKGGGDNQRRCSQVAAALASAALAAALAAAPGAVAARDRVASSVQLHLQGVRNWANAARRQRQRGIGIPSI